MAINVPNELHGFVFDLRLTKDDVIKPMLENIIREKLIRLSERREGTFNPETQKIEYNSDSCSYDLVFTDLDGSVSNWIVKNFIELKTQIPSFIDNGNSFTKTVDKPILNIGDICKQCSGVYGSSGIDSCFCNY